MSSASVSSSSPSVAHPLELDEPRKVCRSCLELLPLAHFKVSSKGKVAPRCKVCEEHRRNEPVKVRKLDPEARSARIFEILASGRKCCRDCGQTKPLEKFRKNSKSPDGHEACCSVCRASKEDAVDPVDIERVTRWRSREALQERELASVRARLADIDF